MLAKYALLVCFAMLIAMSCVTKKSKRVENPLNPTTQAGLPAEEPKARGTIDASRLRVEHLTAALGTMATESIVKVDFSPVADSSYGEVSVCTLDAPVTCDPSKENPRQWTNPPLFITQVPGKAVEISVRVCVKPEAALDPANNCGPFSKVQINAKVNPPSPLGKLLAANDADNSKLQQACAGALKVLETIAATGKNSSNPEIQKLSENAANGAALYVPSSCADAVTAAGGLPVQEARGNIDSATNVTSTTTTNTVTITNTITATDTAAQTPPAPPIFPTAPTSGDTGTEVIPPSGSSAGGQDTAGGPTEGTDGGTGSDPTVAGTTGDGTTGGSGVEPSGTTDGAGGDVTPPSEGGNGDGRKIQMGFATAFLALSAAQAIAAAALYFGPHETKAATKAAGDVPANFTEQFENAALDIDSARQKFETWRSTAKIALFDALDRFPAEFEKIRPKDVNPGALPEELKAVDPTVPESPAAKLMKLKELEIFQDTFDPKAYSSERALQEQATFNKTVYEYWDARDKIYFKTGIPPAYPQIGNLTAAQMLPFREAGSATNKVLDAANLFKSEFRSQAQTWIDVRDNNPRRARLNQAAAGLRRPVGMTPIGRMKGMWVDASPRMKMAMVLVLTSIATTVVGSALQGTALVDEDGSTQAQIAALAGYAEQVHALSSRIAQRNLQITALVGDSD